MTRLLIIVSSLLILQSAIAQEDTWDLETCVRYALDNNLIVQQAHLTTRNAELTEKQSRYNRLPTINGSASAGYQFGRTVDPTTNSFNNTRIGFNSYGINGGVTLFDGNRINSEIKQSQTALEATRLDAEDTRQTIALNVATTYLNILLAEEQLANAETQRQLAQQQLDRTARLVEVGQLAPNARLDLEAQVARNEQLIIEAQNLVDIGYLSLKQLLQVDPARTIVLEKPEAAVEDRALVQRFELEEVYRTAMNNQPGVAAARARVESNVASEQVAKSGNLPTLTLFGNLNTNYSSAARDFDSPDDGNAVLVPNDPVPVVIDGNEIDVVFFRQEGVVFPNLGYTDQLSENFGQSAGLSLNVPIYNNHRNNINRERARINVLNAEMAARQATDQLKTDVQTAITQFRASRNAYLAAQRSQDAADAAFNDAQRRFDVGAINTFEFNNAVDNLDVARRELSRAKYQLLFNLKVVEFYMGQPLQF